MKRKSAAASRRKRQAVHTESSSGVGEADATTTTTTTPSEEAQSTEPATSKMLPCTSHKVTRMLADFRHLLTSHAASHPECAKYAPAISKYMRNQFPFLGLKAPARRALQKQFLAEHGSSFEDRQTLTEFVGGLWEEEERDFQGFGVDLLAQYRETLLGDTEEHFREAVGVVKHCVITKSWWDTVDAISYPGNISFGAPIW